MKKILVIAIIALIAQLSYGQQKVDQLFNNFRTESDITSVNMDTIATKLALFKKSMGVEGIEILRFNDCEQNVKERLDTAIKNLKDPAYETMIKSNKNNSHTRILVKIEENKIRELVILTTGDDYALIRLKGNMDPRHMGKFINDHKDNGR
ncbi:DUF4252 domain-containing protein [Bacteroides faecalis]|uniref:DUF4252 domain-containing protein n=1 Tax=Bacteroides faecalis TaxID=2447885 RepID=A0A401LW71_9BACE|nr:DUF4252 domain-containing protein [Bacteroides faecalis]GCB35764.1 hypothetical protein KGMB02408_27090 [Bacteroides faecalis]